MTARNLMRLLEGCSLETMIFTNRARGFEGLLRNGELFVEVDESSRALFVNAESAELEQQVLYSLGDRLRKLRNVMGRRLEEYAMTLLLLDHSEPFDDVVKKAEHDSRISAAEFMDGITWHVRNPGEGN